MAATTNYQHIERLLRGRCVYPVHANQSLEDCTTVVIVKSLPPSMVRFPINVRIDGDAVFTKNGRAFDGHSGEFFSNMDGGTAM